MRTALFVIAVLASLLALSVEFDFGPSANAQPLPGEVQPRSAPVGPEMDNTCPRGHVVGYTQTPRPVKEKAKDSIKNPAFGPDDNFMSSYGKLRLDDKNRTGRWMSHEEAVRLAGGEAPTVGTHPTPPPRTAQAERSAPTHQGTSSPPRRITTRSTTNSASSRVIPPPSPAPSAATTPTTDSTANSIEPAAVESPAPDKLQKLEERVYDLETRLGTFSLPETDTNIERANATANAASGSADQALQASNQAQGTANRALRLADAGISWAGIALFVAVPGLIIALAALAAAFLVPARVYRRMGVRFGPPPDEPPAYRAAPPAPPQGAPTPPT